MQALCSDDSAPQLPATERVLFPPCIAILTRDMPGIFISYRRIDTVAWAGRLFADLAKRFDSSQVFMDINGGIPRGANFEDVLKKTLAGCDALLVLIGPQWLSCERDGRRRLEIDDDWVRNEVASALARNIVVVPVLLGNATLPPEADLPEDLRLLRKRNTAEILDTRWDYDVEQLVRDLLKLTTLKQLEDTVASADTGLRVLKELIRRSPDVAEAVSRSKEVIENTQRQVARLELFKTLHDALHNVEFDCLRPMQASGSAARIRPFRIRFNAEARNIDDALKSGDINPALRDDLIDQLKLTTAAFQAAVDSPGEAAYAQVLAELQILLSGLPSRLDSAIGDAAAELNFDRFVELMTAVAQKLPPNTANQDSKLQQFVEGIDAVKRLRTELGRRVSEHTRLQQLDSRLRTVIMGGAPPGRLALEWTRIRGMRSKLTEPYSPEVGAAIEDLLAIEKEIDSALIGDKAPEAFDLFSEYFRSVTSVFRDVDTSLMEFCVRFSTVNQPLNMLLTMS